MVCAKIILFLPGILQLQYVINMYKNHYRLTEAYSEYLEEQPCSDSAETICAKFDQVSLTRNMDESVEALRKVCKFETNSWSGLGTKYLRRSNASEKQITFSYKNELHSFRSQKRYM